MIGWGRSPSTQEEIKPKGFDDFDLRLGDVLRGERATQSKSLLDVQRELRIKASYIAGIEACDVSAFETPSFIAGFVRSYARYLGVDPDWAFERFCAESGYKPTHGMALQASGPKANRRTAALAEPLSNPHASFIPKTASVWSRIDPRAVGSVLVLALLVGGLGYGGWNVLHEVQRVNLAPVDRAPAVAAELDPLHSVAPVQLASAQDAAPVAPAPEAMDRLYRPTALETPVLIARDGPIAAIDPRQAGLLAGSSPAPQGMAGTGMGTALTVAENAQGVPMVRTLGAEAPEVEILAARPSWVRITASDGSVVFEKVMDAGERFAVPKLEEPSVLRTGESGAIYFAVNGVAYGPAGPKGAVTKNIILSPETIGASYAMADLGQDVELAKMTDVADAGAVAPQIPAAPLVSP